MTISEQPQTVDLFRINPRRIGVTSSVIGEDNHRIDCIIREKEGAGFGDVLTLESSIINQEAWFDISKIIDVSFDLPDLVMITGQTFHPCTSMIREYQIQLEEYYGEPVELQNTSQFTAWALLGAVGEHRDYGFYADFSVNHKFLTHQPRTKLITREQPEFLYFPVFNTHYYSLRTRLFFSNGEVEDLSFIPIQDNHNFQANEGEVYCFSVGFRQLQLANQETADRFLLKYEARLSFHDADGGAEVGSSEIMTYEIDYDSRSWPDRYILFLNSLGGMDTFCTRGKANLQGKISRTNRDIPERLGSSQNEHRRAASYTSSQQELRVNTGWIDEATRIWLEDMALSKRAWLIDINNPAFIPIENKTTDLPINQDDESLQSMELILQLPAKQAL